MPDTDTFVLQSSVAFADVDRDNRLTLQGMFKLLQEAAIAHANEYDTGTDAMAARGESWVLKRMAVAIDRYPAYGEPLRVETWSTGIRVSKGYRDFRVYAGGAEPIARGSSLWLYISMRARSVIRVPPEIAARFPSRPADVFLGDLDTLAFDPPEPASADAVRLSLRYSDVDANDHVNNTAYLELLQTALAQLGHPARPRDVRIKYGKGIPGGTPAVDVRLAPAAPAGGPVTFSIASGDEIFAQGSCG